MGGAPTLISLCLGAIGAAIPHGRFGLEEISELPPHLLESLLMSLDPLALELLHPKVPEEFHNHLCMVSRGSANGPKRQRSVDLNDYWKSFFLSRWPTFTNINIECEICDAHGCFTDWQQLYWERHLQSCLDEASEKASLPGFTGYLGEIKISDNMVDSISKSKDKSIGAGDLTRLSYHCLRFGHYARHLRLRNVLCVAEMCDLLTSSNLQHVVICNIKLGLHVDGACNLLARNQKSLLSLEFLCCTLPPKVMDKICGFLGRSLLSLKFCETQLGSTHAKSIFSILLHLSSPLSVFEISDSDIKSWQYNANFKYRSIFASWSGRGASSGSLSSIRVLNLRGNELDKNDAQDLRCSLVNMQSLCCLNLSDNPFTDDGVRILIPFFLEAMEKTPPLVDLKLENCHLSSAGVAELVEHFLSSKQSLKSLSIACNELGRSTALSLARFLQYSDIKTLNIEDIGLGSPGFDDLDFELSGDLHVVNLNTSKNRGGIAAARCISKIILHAPELVAINASHNLLPAHSVEILSHALEHSKGKLKQLDLTGNMLLQQTSDAAKLLEFYYEGKPIVILPTMQCPPILYDDDP